MTSPSSPTSRCGARSTSAGVWYEKDERLSEPEPRHGRAHRVGAPLQPAGRRGGRGRGQRRPSPGGRRPPCSRGSTYLDVLRSLLIQEGDALASLITQENGKPLAESHFGGRGRRPGLPDGPPQGRPGLPEGPAREGHEPAALWRKRLTVRRVPLGVVGVISPWNLPLAIPLGQIVTALAAGNTVVFKPSELTPLVGVKIATTLPQGGVPARRFQPRDGRQGDRCLPGGSAHRRAAVHGLHRRGTADPGPARDPTGDRPQMELGGKDAFLVLPDADYERTVNGALWCGLFGSGPGVLLLRALFRAPLLDAPLRGGRGRARGRAFKVGDGMDETVQVGPLISEEQRARVEAQVEDAVARGARLLCGGRRPDRRRVLLRAHGAGGRAPGLRPHARGDLRARHPRGALRRPGGRPSPGATTRPSASRPRVWTSDPQKGEAVARRLQAGPSGSTTPPSPTARPSVPGAA